MKRSTLNRRRNFAERVRRLLMAGHSFIEAVRLAVWDRRRKWLGKKP